MLIFVRTNVNFVAGMELGQEHVELLQSVDGDEAAGGADEAGGSD